MKIFAFILSLTVIIFSSGPNASAQDDSKVCKVEVESLQGSYTGSCRKGLAQGEGKAMGMDTYEGTFKKGWPHGDGTYSWRSGAKYTGEWKYGKRHGYGIMTEYIDGEENTYQGYWQDDEFKGEDAGPAYRISTQRNIDRVSVKRMGDGTSVSCKIQRNGMNFQVDNLMVNADSGLQFQSGIDFGFQSISFPINIKVNFNAPSKMGGQYYLYEMDIEVLRPGHYEIIIMI